MKKFIDAEIVKNGRNSINIVVVYIKEYKQFLNNLDPIKICDNKTLLKNIQFYFFC